MKISALIVLIFGCWFIVSADTAVQTIWSGGPGVPGPVTDWEGEFSLCTGIDWAGVPGSAVLTWSVGHTVDGGFISPLAVCSQDLDGDGDTDVIGSSFLGEVVWWENSDTGPGIYWAEHVIDGSFVLPHSVYSEDVDGDGDMDVLGAAGIDDDITWWENSDGYGATWLEHTIDGSFDNARSVYAVDIDGDGDIDVLGAAGIANDIAWWENADGTGTSWLEHTVDSSFDGAWSVHADDIDGDGDMDVLGAARYNGMVSWWENTEGSGTSWIEHTVSIYYVDTWSVYSRDIDGDGDLDILEAADAYGELTWWENGDGSGGTWTKHAVCVGFDGAKAVYAEDMDGDGDIDVIGAGLFENTIAWWENVDGSGNSWIEHVSCSDCEGAFAVYTGDFDGDGHLDILGAANTASRIEWYSATSEGILESSILDTQCAPGWDYIDWSAAAPAGSSVSFQVRASDDFAAMGSWSDVITQPSPLAGILSDGDRYFQYRVILSSIDSGSIPSLDEVAVSWDPMGIEGGENPVVPVLLPVAPNPSSSPIVRFGIPEPGPAGISVFDLTGRLVLDEVTDYQAGFHEMALDGLSAGIYFCRMTSGDFSASERFVVIE